MDRRRFLRDVLCGFATAAVGLSALRSFPALAGDPARFADGLRAHPWLAGWRSVSSQTLGPATVAIEGRLPRGLAGTLYRNGPAWTERAGFRYEHWFDGDGMVHGWRFNGDGTLTHHARMVATPKFQREQATGRFLYPAAGTAVPDLQPIRNNDDANAANTSVMVLNGRLFALCEAGSAFELDPDQLDTIGPVTWRPDLASIPFSAHPLVDRDGSVWNFGAIGLMGGNGLMVWHLGRDGGLLGAHMLPTPALGYLHAFAMTDRHLLFVLVPFVFSGSGAFFQRMRFTPDQPCMIAVVPKDAPDTARWFEAEFAAIYHFGDAFERDGQIVLRTVRHEDVEAARSPMRAAMHGEAAHADHSRAHLAELRLDLRGGTARWEATGVEGIEFPLFDPRSPAGRGARLYAPTIAGTPRAPYFNAVGGYDLARGRQQVHAYGPEVLAEEHVFVPRPGGRGVDDGWLVGTVLDAARQRSGITVLDARRIDEGPLAQAWLPYTVPLGFHGTFRQA